MILINGTAPEIKTFGDETIKMNIDPSLVCSGTNEITWHYESDKDLFYLFIAISHLKKIYNISDISLRMLYTPNARMDRVHTDPEVFTLEYFAEFLKSFDFSSIEICDPHSDVIVDMLKSSTDVIITYPLKDFIEDYVATHDIIAFYPDNGAFNKYSKVYNFDENQVTHGQKHRDFTTGQLSDEYTIANPDLVKNKDVIIIDDICSYGGTFLRAANILKEHGAKSIILAVTHLENAVLLGKLPSSDLIDKIYTTDSIFTGEQGDFITVLPIK